MDNPLHIHRHHAFPEPREFRVQITGIAIWAIQEFFVASLVTYLVFFLIDSLIGSFVSQQFDMNILLWVVIVSGTLSVFLNPHPAPSVPDEGKRKLTVPMILFIGTLGIITVGIVFLKTRSLGRLGYLVAGISGILVILLSFVLLFEDEGNNNVQ
ncbi:MAG: hypothetical protein V1907_04080 [Candidatus Kerfeldbacteria bacterium]